jgi:hypothetical protein
MQISPLRCYQAQNITMPMQYYPSTLTTLPLDPNRKELPDCDRDRPPSLLFTLNISSFFLISLTNHSFLSSSSPPQILMALTRRSRSVSASVAESSSIRFPRRRGVFRAALEICPRRCFGVDASESSANVESATSRPTLNTRIRWRGSDVRRGGWAAG